MTSHDGSPPQISWWYVVVVTADLIDPSVAWAARTTPPALIRKVSERKVDVTPECLVSWRVFGEPSDVSKDNVPATRDEVQYWVIGARQFCYPPKWRDA